MTTSFRCQEQAAKAEVLQRYLQSPASNGQSPAVVQDIQDVLAACLRVPDEMKSLWQAMSQAAELHPELRQSVEPWAMLQGLFRIYLDMFPRISEWVNSTMPHGNAEKLLTELSVARRQLDRLHHEVFLGMDVRSVWTAEGQFERGEGRPMEEVFASLRASE